MILGIVGNRTVSFPSCSAILERCIRENHPDLVVSGGAYGVDSHAIQIAQDLGVSTKVFYPEDLNNIGISAYFIRNRKIVMASDVLVCVYAGSVPSGGTYYTHRFAQKQGKEVIPVYLQKGGEDD